MIIHDMERSNRHKVTLGKSHAGTAPDAVPVTWEAVAGIVDFEDYYLELFRSPSLATLSCDCASESFPLPFCSSHCITRSWKVSLLHEAQGWVLSGVPRPYRGS